MYSGLLTHFLLPKDETLDYLSPVWDSLLPLFPPVDHQPAGVVMEGENCWSASSSIFSVHFFHCADGRVNTTIICFLTSFCLLLEEEVPAMNCFLSRKCQHESRACHSRTSAQKNPSLVQASDHSPASFMHRKTGAPPSSFHPLLTWTQYSWLHRWHYNKASTFTKVMLFFFVCLFQWKSPLLNAPSVKAAWHKCSVANHSGADPLNRCSETLHVSELFISL